MADVIHEFRDLFFDDECNLYVVRAYGEEVRPGRWGAWLGFHGNGETWLTPPATVQTSRAALETWACNLTQAWLDRALATAKVSTMRNRELLVIPSLGSHPLEAPAPVC